jgi:sensor c-di-GMP phosphodiesterase-like protein
VLHRDGGRGNGNGNGHAVADAVIGLGQSLHREVIAEGVEDEADMEYLRARGVEYCQGFLLAAPMPAAEFAEWWRRRQQEGRPPPRLRVSEVAVAQAPGT